MEVKTFLITFEQSLINCGFSSVDARSHTLKIAKSLSDSDKRRIHVMEDRALVVDLAENYAARIDVLRENSEIDVSNPDTMTISRHFSESVSDDETEDGEGADDKAPDEVQDGERDDDEIKIADAPHVDVDKKTRTRTKTPRVATQKIDAVDKPKKIPLTPEGKENYKRWMMSSGIGVGIAVFFASLGAGIVYVLIAALITALIALLVAVVAIGCVSTLAGLIYGIIRILSIVPEGLYEIGLALVIFGITLAASIGIYNLALRAVPILWKNFTKYLKGQSQELRTYINKIRTECNGE